MRQTHDFKSAVRHQQTKNFCLEAHRLTDKAPQNHILCVSTNMQSMMKKHNANDHVNTMPELARIHA